MKRVTVLTVGPVFITLLAAFAHAQEAQKPEAVAKSQHVMLTESDLKWTDPAALPAGAKLAVLEGDPTQVGPFTMRLKFPAGYKIPAHWHPVDEHVTVLSGAFNMGMGDKLDEKASRALPVGSFVVMPAKTNHFAWTKDGATVQLHGMGPWGITYVNPADDPRIQKATTTK